LRKGIGQRHLSRAFRSIKKYGVNTDLRIGEAMDRALCSH
jgi:hypothetical protein